MPLRFPPGQRVEVRYKPQSFDQLVGSLRGERFSSRGTLVAFVGAEKLQMESAAQELAAELGMTLRRIGLGAVEGKFIGETEKNLCRLLDSASPANTILFFDEADALFGKRADVSDGHDRYDDAGTNYLSRAAADYRGIVIALFKSPGGAGKSGAGERQVVVRFPPW